MRISDWSSDVCSSDLAPLGYAVEHLLPRHIAAQDGDEGVFGQAIGGQQLLEALTIELSRLVVKSLFPMNMGQHGRVARPHAELGGLDIIERASHHAVKHLIAHTHLLDRKSVV